MIHSSKRCPVTGSKALASGEGGFTLMELVIVMALGIIILGAMYSVFVIHKKSFHAQEQIAEMQQSARAAMDMISREIKMAGYNPAGASFDGIPFDSSQLRLRADLNGDGSISGPFEDVIYAYDGAHERITRDGGIGAEPLVDHVQSFAFEYLDGNAATTAATADIRQIRITLVLKTADPDPDYTDPVYADHYRRYTLASLVIPRNLNL